MIWRLVTFAAVVTATPAAAAPELSAAWSDHAVIQRDQPIVVEGKAQSGETVEATLGDEHQSATAGSDGRFALRFAPRPASSAPLTLAINGSSAASDLLVGDVWLCSGQSNMEMSTERALDGWSQVNGSADAGLRLLLVPKDTAPVPSDAFGSHAAWTLATPATVGPFSAACYHMAKELRRKLKIPIGAIASDWGGSQIRAWLTPEVGLALYGRDEMALLTKFTSDPLAANTQFAPRWEKWYGDATSGSEPWLKPDSIDWVPVPKIGVWNDWTGSPLVEKPAGTVWLRRTIVLTDAQARAGGSLQLGVLDDMDSTWVNGHIVGNTFSWDAKRNYQVPRQYLKAGANEIIVAVSSSWGTGGFTSGPELLAFTVTGGPRIPLAEGWRYSIAPVTNFPPRSPWDTNAGIGVMHNRMVAPLGHIALKGAAWYQGESDVGNPGYRDRLTGLFKGWRGQFGPQMRMLVVQLPNFGPGQTAPTPSGWAMMREDQREAIVADSNAALIPTMDIGERNDIHPANKVELGHRLALGASGEPLPSPVSATAEGDKVRVRFSGINGGLAVWSGKAPLGFELCGADQASCRYAEAAIDRDSVVLAADGKPATRVRYAWGESPVVNLFDARSIPMPGFELPITRP
jgi:sialate O-acetylesterase